MIMELADETPHAYVPFLPAVKSSQPHGKRNVSAAKLIIFYKTCKLLGLFFGFFHKNCLISHSHYHIDDHRSTENRGYGIEGNDASGGRECAENIAEKGCGGSCEHGNRHEYAVTACADYHAGYVGNGKSDERNRSAEGGDDGCEKSCDHKEYIAHAGCVDSEILRIALSKENDV